MIQLGEEIAKTESHVDANTFKLFRDGLRSFLECLVEHPAKRNAVLECLRYNLISELLSFSKLLSFFRENVCSFRPNNYSDRRMGSVTSAVCRKLWPTERQTDIRVLEKKLFKAGCWKKNFFKQCFSLTE